MKRSILFQEKGQYEVTQGQLKSSEELGDFCIDILRRYPTVILMIDPIPRVVSCH